MKTRKTIAWLLCFVMLISACTVFPANATLINEGTITNDGDIGNEGNGFITVTFLSGSPANLCITQTAIAGQWFALEANTFTREDYVFLNWVDSDGCVFSDGATVSLHEDITLTAVWQDNSPVGGGGEDAPVSGDNGAASEPGTTTETGGDNGATSETGTTTENGGSTSTTTEPGGSTGATTEPGGTTNPGAPTVYFITFYPNREGCSGRMNQQDIPKGNTDNLYPNTYSCTGYRFICWNTRPDGSGTDYSDLARIEPSANVNLYAQWTVETGSSSGGGSGTSSGGGGSGGSGGIGSITITFNPGNTVSNNSPYTQTASSGVETTLTPNRFTNTTGIDPYTFLYWADANGNTYADGASVTFYGDISLTAVWAGSNSGSGGNGGGAPDPAAETVTVTFRSGYEGGDADYTQTVEKGVTTCLDEISFMRSGYTFYLWAGDDGNQYSNGESVSFVEDVTLIAIWVESASNSGAINGGENSITYSPSAADHDPRGYISVFWNGNVGSAVTVTPHPSYGYSFLGLDVTAASGASIYPSANADTGVSSFSMPQGDVTITGNFARTRYNITVVTEHATVTGMPSTAYVGDTVTFHVLPETGYRVTRVILKDPNASVINNPVDLLTGAIESEEELSFTMPDHRPTVEVVTTRIVYDISYDLQGGGTHDDITSAAPGESVTIVFYTDDGYEFTSGWVTKASGGAVYTDFGSGELLGSVSFTMPDEAVTVHTVREHMPRSISYYPDDGVTLVTAPASARPGSTVTVSFTVPDGYELAGAYSDILGESFDSSPLSFTMPEDDVDLHILIVGKVHNVTLNSSGTGAATGESSARVGETVRVDFDPDNGCEVIDFSLVTASGAAVAHTGDPINGSYYIEFVMPDDDVVMTAVFGPERERIWYFPDSVVHLVNVPPKAYVGDSVTVGFTIDDGYELVEAEVSGTNYSAKFYTNPFTFTMPEDACVWVKAQKKTYSFSVDITNASMLTAQQVPTGAVCDARVDFSFTPVEGYEVAEFSVTTDGGETVTLYDNSPYFTLFMPKDNVTFHATVRKISYEIEYYPGDDVTINGPTRVAWGETVTIPYSLATGAAFEKDLSVKYQSGTDWVDLDGATIGTDTISFVMPKARVLIDGMTYLVRYPITSVHDNSVNVNNCYDDALYGSTVYFSVMITDSVHSLKSVTARTSSGENVPVEVSRITDSRYDCTLLMPADSIVITVETLGASHSITYQIGEGATLETAPTTAREGEDVTVSYTLEPGYRLYYGDITGNNGAYWQSISTTPFTFTMPAFDVLIEIATMHPTYTVTDHVDGTLGSIVTNVGSAHYGEEISFTVQVNDPDEYKLKSLTVRDNYGAELALSSYTVGDTLYYYFDMPMGGADIYAEIAKYFTVTFAPNGGDGDPITTETFEWDTVTLPYCDFTPPEGTYFAGWDFGGLYLKSGTKTVFSSNSTVNAHWNTASTVYAGISETNGTLFLDLYIRTCYSRPEDHSLLISGGGGTFEYTLDDAVFEQDYVFGNEVYKISVELTTARLVEGFAYVVDDLDGNGDWIMAAAGLFNFAADPTASAVSVEVEDFDTGVSQIQPSNGEFLFALPPYGPTVTVTYPWTAPVYYGDANADGAVDIFDIILIAQYILDNTVELSSGAADANGDYMIDTSDVILIAQYILDNNVVLGPQPSDE